MFWKLKSEMEEKILKAIFHRKSPEGVALLSAPKPKLSLKTVLVKVHAAGLNPVDSKNLIGDKLPTWCEPLAKWKVEGKGVGFDFSGVVESAPQNSGFHAGDEVYGTMPPMGGSIAEYISVPIHQLSKKPTNLTHIEAAALPLVGLTCTEAFEDQKMLPGQHLLVIGASGGVGHIAVQIAKAKGAIVTAICGKKNFEFVKDLGADKIIDYNGENVIKELQDVIKQEGSFDIVLDTVSSHDPRDRAFNYEAKIRGANLLRKDGKSMYLTIGGVFKDWVCAWIKRVFKINLFARGKLLFWVRFPYSSGYLETLTKYVQNGKLKLTISSILPFSSEGIQKGFQMLKSRKTKGKIVIKII
jgi:NADPH:quinone reductase-like Zn-dependent oxidoreductase